MTIALLTWKIEDSPYFLCKNRLSLIDRRNECPSGTLIASANSKHSDGFRSDELEIQSSDTVSQPATFYRIDSDVHLHTCIALRFRIFKTYIFCLLERRRRRNEKCVEMPSLWRVYVHLCICVAARSYPPSADAPVHQCVEESHGLQKCQYRWQTAQEETSSTYEDIYQLIRQSMSFRSNGISFILHFLFVGNSDVCHRHSVSRQHARGVVVCKYISASCRTSAESLVLVVHRLRVDAILTMYRRRHAWCLVVACNISNSKY